MSLSKVDEMKNSEDIGGLIKLLEDSDWEVRYKSAEALGFVGKSQIGLLHEALNSENILVRWGAAYALGGVKDSNSVPYLKEALKKEDVGNIRKWIVYALGEIGSSDVIEPLIDVLKKKEKTIEGVMTKRWAAHVLGYIGDAESLQILKKESKDKYPIQRAQANWAIGKIEYDLQYQKTDPIPEIEELTAELKSLNLTPAESYVIRLYHYHDKDDIGEFMMIYTLLDMIIRGALTSYLQVKAKKKGFISKKMDIEEKVILKKGENLENLDLKPHERKMVEYVEGKGIELKDMKIIMDDDRIGAKFREDGIKYLAGQGYFEEGQNFKGTDLKLTDKGSKASETINDALKTIRNLRIWMKEAPSLAEEYLSNVGGNVFIHRMCFLVDDDVPKLTRKVNESKTPEEKLLCYYWVMEGLRTNLNKK
ncbi:MAG: HEAT repeat domain-containing protein [Methanobacterium sp.]|uniref:HEAT repeat domain-containing protein n=1 Tax=Methanobacterium sp. TaxID=2164 RepID=UPI003D658404|nr:HEAT repeat domain-containing protein [Methanobacterium sp.]